VITTLRLLGFGLCLALCTWVTGAAQSDFLQPYFPTLHKYPLVYIDDSVLAVYDFGAYLAGTGAVPTGRRDNDIDSLKNSLESFIDEAVIAIDMDRAALLSDPQAVRRGRWRLANAAGPLAFQHFIAPQIQVSEDAIGQFYRDSLAARFTAPERREVRHILFAPRAESKDGRRLQGREQIQAAQEAADSTLRAIQNGASFESLASALSDDTVSRGRGGYIGWIYPGNTTFAFDSAAFNAEIGVPRGPIRSVYGYHLILVEAERPESTIALHDSVRFEITRDLANDQSRRLGTLWADSMIAAADWKFNETALADTTGGLPDETWMVAINGRDTLWWGEWKGGWEYYKRTEGIQGAGTPEDKRASLKRSAYPYLYLHAAEDAGYADDPPIVAEMRLHLRSEALRQARGRLRDMQDSIAATLPQPDTAKVAVEFEKPLHLQMLRTRDSAQAWAAYKKLVAGNRFQTVAGWYHDNKREVRVGLWDLGWVGRDDLPPRLFGPAWILGVGKYTRPIQTDSGFYIFRLEDRRAAPNRLEDLTRARNELIHTSRALALKLWRQRIREGNRIRVDRSSWQRVTQLWRR